MKNICINICEGHYDDLFQSRQEMNNDKAFCNTKIAEKGMSYVTRKKRIHSFCEYSLNNRQNLRHIRFSSFINMKKISKYFS